MASTGPPIATVYVSNLEERVKPEPLRAQLLEFFSEFGNVIEIIAKTNLKAKGQAFIVYDDPEAAAEAVEEGQGFELFDKPMKLALAKTRSDVTVKRGGSEEEFEAHKRRRIAEMDKKKALEAEQQRLKPTPVEQSANTLAAAAAASKPVKGARGAGLKATGPAASNVVPDEYLPPNNILFVQNLPDDFGVEALTGIFSQFDGFREVRLVPGRKGIAFVEYDAEPGAITAKENTGGMQVEGGKAIKVTYQRQ